MAQIGQTLTNLQNYNDEINVPTISAVGHTGQYSDILNPPVISTIGHTGQYTDVLNPPVISTAGHTGSYTDLINQPALSTVAYTGSYNNLSNQPSIIQGQAFLQSGGNGSNTAASTVCTILQTNCGIYYSQSGLAQSGTGFSITHFLPAAGTGQYYVPSVSLLGANSGLHNGQVVSVTGVTNSEINFMSIEFDLQGTNSDLCSLTHGSDDIVFTWTCSLIQATSNTYAQPPKTATNTSPQTLNA